MSYKCKLFVLKIVTCYGLVSLFNSISTFVDYLMPSHSPRTVVILFIYLPTPPLEQNMTQGQFLSGV